MNNRRRYSLAKEQSLGQNQGYKYPEYIFTVNLEQKQKQPSPIDETLVGILIVVKLVHSLKHCFPIEETLVGILIVLKL